MCSLLGTPNRRFIPANSANLQQVLCHFVPKAPSGHAGRVPVGCLPVAGIQSRGHAFEQGEVNMSHWMRAVIGAIAVAGLASGCASKSAKSSPEIKSEWVAPIPPEDMQPVTQARAEQTELQQQISRDEIELKDAKNELKATKTRQSAAKKSLDAENTMLKSAQSQGDQQLIDEAQARVNQAQLHHQVSEAAVTVGEERISAMEAALGLTKAQEKRQEVEVSQTEYTALKDQGDTRVQDIDPNAFNVSLQQRDADIAAQQAKLNQAQSDSLRTAQKSWQTLNDQLEASASPQPD